MSQQSPSETLVFDQRDVTTSDRIRFSPNGVTVDGPGVIETVMVRCDQPSFSVTVETDQGVIINDDWKTLENIAADLNHIDAYEDRNEYVVVVQEYPYAEWSRATVNPHGEVNFDRIRGEWIRGNPVSY